MSKVLSRIIFACGLALIAYGFYDVATAPMTPEGQTVAEFQDLKSRFMLPAAIGGFLICLAYWINNKNNDEAPEETTTSSGLILNLFSKNPKILVTQIIGAAIFLYGGSRQYDDYSPDTKMADLNMNMDAIPFMIIGGILLFGPGIYYKLKNFK